MNIFGWLQGLGIWGLLIGGVVAYWVWTTFFATTATQWHRDPQDPSRRRAPSPMGLGSKGKGWACATWVAPLPSESVPRRGHHSAAAKLTIVVGGNSTPNVGKDDYLTEAGNSIRINIKQGLLANDMDKNGERLTINSTGVFETLFGGEVNIMSNGGFTYTSPPNFDGFDSFTYAVSDGEDSVTGIAEISVSPEVYK